MDLVERAGNDKDGWFHGDRSISVVALHCSDRIFAHLIDAKGIYILF